MIKIKTVITTYKLTENEVIFAIRDYIQNKLRLSDDFLKDSVELQPYLDEDLKIIEADITFTHKY